LRDSFPVLGKELTTRHCCSWRSCTNSLVLSVHH